MKYIKSTLAIIIFSLLCLTDVYSQEISFNHLVTENGLSNNSVISLYQDAKGYIWIGTRNGVNLYNGNEFITYKSHKSDPNSLIFNNIQKITGNGKDEVYFMTPKGVSALNTTNNQFTTLIQGYIRAMHYHKDLYVTKDSHIYRHNGKQFEPYYTLNNCSNIGALYVCDDYMLIGTEEHGLFRLDKQKKLTQLLPKVNVINIFQDSVGRFWIGTWENGLYVMDGNSMKNYLHTESDPKSISSNFVRSFCEDKQGNMWVGTFHGLNRFNAHSGTFSCYQKSEREHSLTHSSIWSLLCDEQGTVWIGTYFGGVNYFTPQYQIYHHIQVSKVEAEGLSFPIVGPIVEDNQHNLWIGTEGGGVNKYSPKEGTFQWFKNDKYTNSLSQDNVKSLYHDSTNEVLWIGTHLGGLNKLDLRNEQFTRYQSNREVKGSLPSNTIRDIIPYKKQLILATHAGVCMFNPENGKSQPILHQEPYNIAMANTLCVDHRNTLWATGNGEGIYSYHFDTHATKNYKHNPALKQSLSSNSINRIYQDSQNRLWICTSEAGIDIYRYETDDFENLDKQRNGIESNCIYDVCELSPERLLFITDVGFSILDYATRTFTNYNRGVGVPLSATNERALFKASNGDIYIGGMNGMIAFREKDIDRTWQKYEIHPFRLFVNGEEVEVNDQTQILDKTLEYTDKLILKHNQSMFSIEYTTSNYISYNKDEMEFYLEGFSRVWTSTRGQHNITYTNLNPGSYTLIVRAKNNPFVPESKLQIEILPPFYQTIWAYLLYALGISLISFYLIRVYNHRIKLQESLKYEKKHAEDIEHLNQAKLRFFTNISHEFRTPLTLIIGQMEMLLQIRSFTPIVYNKILGVYKNSLQLRELVTELLDFRKQEQGHMLIKVSEHNTVSFVYEIYLLFQEYAIQRNITLNFYKSHDNLPAWYDTKQMQKVINNLLSNAFKYSKEGGEISVSVRKGNQEVIIEVTDNGCGIDSENIQRIFERFYQVDQVESLLTGTGIGLSLSKGIVELHHGTIEVFSEPGEGSTFCIHLKTGKEHFTSEQLTNNVQDSFSSLPEETYALDGLLDEQEILNNESPIGKFSGKRREIKILIVEDNESLKEMLVKLFTPFYTVITASNGQEGWEKTLSDHPHIVLSDVVMPEMSGTELCKRIKEQIETCHIPVVLLTAQTSTEHNLEGLRTGADDYITKPFNINILLSRCNNLVNNRIVLQEKFSQQPSATPQILATNPLDKELVDKAMNVIEQHLDNVDFNVNILAKEVGIARTKLFTKLKDITGQTPYEFIITIRLKRAALMLRENPELNVSEISDRLGFSSPRQFSRCFKEKYQVVPQAFRRNKKEDESDTDHGEEYIDE